jgi:aryl-alcohol dehydrogenase-like predicted oxidoreductase
VEKTSIGPLSVSVLSLGAMLFGTKTPEDISRSLLDRFVEQGGNFIDTSNNYAFWQTGSRGGESEALLGRWLKDRGRRDDLIIATKVGAKPNRAGAGLENIEGLGKDVIARDIDETLTRLGTDYVDLYYAHIDDRTTDLEETLEGFEAVVKAGKVRAIGCSNYAIWRVERAIQLSRRHAWPEYVCIQQSHSYFRQQPQSDLRKDATMGMRGGWGPNGGLSGQHLDYLRFNPEFRAIAYTPMLRGAYADPERLPETYRTPDNEKRSAALGKVVHETGASANQVVLAWLLQSSPSIIPLMAVSTAAQLEDNLGSVRVALTPEQIARLDNAA